MKKPRRAQFVEYGVTSDVPRWAMSAITDDSRQLVLCCWKHRFGTCSGGKMWYEYQLSHWKNTPGAKRCHGHLEQAVKASMPVRLIVATAKDKAAESQIDQGSANDAKATFHSKPEYIGRVTGFDGDVFSVLFEKKNH